MMQLITRSTLNYETYNPIIGKEEIHPFRPFQHPVLEPGIALVLFREGEQSLVTFWPGDRINAFKIFRYKYKLVYKVDISEHRLSFNCPTPCESDAFHFYAELHLACSVNNPTAIVTRNVTDARMVLEPLITRNMRRISRKYDVEEIAKAEIAITNSVEEKIAGMGFKLNYFVVKLSLEQDASDHIRKLRQIEYAKVYERKEAELKKQREILEIERLKIKIDFYSPFVEKGQWQLLALQLTHQPEDITTIIQILNQQHQTKRDHQLNSLKLMLEQDVLEKFQLEEVGKHLLQQLLESFVSGLGRKDLTISPEEFSLAGADENVNGSKPDIVEQASQLRTVPLLATVSTPMSEPLPADNIEARITFDQTAMPEVSFALRVQNDELSYIQISPGDVLLIGPQKMVKNGDRVVILLIRSTTTETLFRRIFFDKDSVRLLSESPNLRSITFTKEMAKEQLKVIGTIVRFIPKSEIRSNEVILGRELPTSSKKRGKSITA